MSAPYYADESVTLWHGDALAVMSGLPDASVDAIVTDPPYGIRFMGQAWDGADIEETVTRGRQTSPMPEGIGGTRGGYRSLAAEAGRYDRGLTANQAFQQWCTDWSVECLRVLKPGGHLLAFGGPRTWHRLACAVEDAGFEIRDSIAWLYGSGFPKSLDVSKAIDKRANVNDETHRRIALVAEVIRSHREAKGMERAAVSLAVVGTPSGACWNWEHQQLPSVEMWPAIKATLDISDNFDGLIEGDRAMFIAAERAVIAERRLGRLAVAPGQGEDRSALDYADTAPATDAAARWQGWGTALKPAFEPIVVARKPLAAGTVAANVLAHGTGALNIEACRVEGVPQKGSPHAGSIYGTDGHYIAGPNVEGNPAGRWPTNVILDDTQAAELDRQSGSTRDGTTVSRNRGDERPMTVAGAPRQVLREPDKTYGGEGGASRFFPTFRYEAKAPTLERPRHGETAHPTVKPVDLMRWLVRLVTPPGGLVLDPFAGSGTTAEACVVEGFRCVLIEREADYLPLIVQRLTKPIAPVLDFGASA